MIAAICINRNCSLASFNRKYFDRFKYHSEFATMAGCAASP